MVGYARTRGIKSSDAGGGHWGVMIFTYWFSQRGRTRRGWYSGVGWERWWGVSVTEEAVMLEMAVQG